MNTPTMMKSLGVALVLATGLAGCDLYFGDSSSDSYTYCGEDGEYSCTGDNCTLVSDTCTQGSGFECSSNTDCAAGCYCDDKGVCEEGGFCTSDSDCGDGFHCDTDRGSCEPNQTNTCDSTDPTSCGQGQECTANGQCVSTCTCSDDAEAIQNGFGWCDVPADGSPGTCHTGTNPNGVCGGEVSEVTCTSNPPKCDAGSVPTILDGCWSGECRAISDCEAAPSCGHITDEASCSARTDCGATFVGHDCHSTDGSSCTQDQANCTCSSFTFSSCEVAGN